MRSNNPVFARDDAFNGRSASASGYAAPTVGYSDPSTWSTGTPGAGAPSTYDDRRITLDSVVQKSAITLLVLVAAAAATWIYIGPIDEANAPTLFTLIAAGAGIGFVLAMVNSFKRVVSPALVLAYAAAEGVFIGGFSSLLNQQYGGIVMQAVAGTVAAFSGTLAAYKILNIKVSDKFRRGVVAAMFGMVGVMLLDLLLGAFGIGFLELHQGLTGLLWAGLGVVLAVLMLILDFDFIERAIAAGAPERESWRAAFGLTVTLIWLYINLLQILAITRE